MTSVTVIEQSTTVHVIEDQVFIVSVGIQGPEGAQGPQGPQGLPGSAAASYTHTQSSASSTWTINHNLGYKPAVELLTVGGVEMEGDVVHVSDNQVIVYFVISVAGTARLQ